MSKNGFVKINNSIICYQWVKSNTDAPQVSVLLHNQYDRTALASASNVLNLSRIVPKLLINNCCIYELEFITRVFEYPGSLLIMWINFKFNKSNHMPSKVWGKIT